MKFIVSISVAVIVLFGTTSVFGMDFYIADMEFYTVHNGFDGGVVYRDGKTYDLEQGKELKLKVSDINNDINRYVSQIEVHVQIKNQSAQLQNNVRVHLLVVFEMVMTQWMIEEEGVKDWKKMKRQPLLKVPIVMEVKTINFADSEKVINVKFVIENKKIMKKYQRRGYFVNSAQFTAVVEPQKGEKSIINNRKEVIVIYPFKIL